MLKVSFYSYKGGSGRSTTAWNTIQQLVKIMDPTPEHPFVIVDTDVQSAGATFLFDAENLFKSENPYWSVQKYMIEKPDEDYEGANDTVKKKFFGRMFPIGTRFGLPDEKSRAVLLIGANVDKDSKSNSEADITGKGGEKSPQMDNFRNGIIFACEDCGVKALFFDTPSGSQFLAKMSVQKSDITVCCMRPTSQFRTGTHGQLIHFLQFDIGQGSVGKRKYILTPTAVCVDKDQNINSKDYPETAHKVIKDQFSAEKLEKVGDDVKKAFSENVIRDMLELETQEEDKNSVDKIFGIPENKRFKWFEACLGALPDSELSDNDRMVLKRYNYLAQTILKYWNGK